jgi:hypothetical protein
MCQVLGTKCSNFKYELPEILEYMDGPLYLKETRMTVLQIAYAMIAASYLVAVVALWLGH